MVHFNAAELGQPAQAAGRTKQAALQAEHGHAGGLKSLQAQDGRLHSSPVVQGQALQALQVLQRAQQPGRELRLACKAQRDIIQALQCQMKDQRAADKLPDPHHVLRPGFCNALIV